MEEYKPVTLNGTRYLVRMTGQDSIDIEDELGMLMRDACKTMSMKIAACVVGHSILYEDKQKVPSKEWKKLLKEISIIELLNAAGAVLGAGADTEQAEETDGDSEKN